MNDNRRFLASTPTVPKSADGTPPERQILLPLTPLAADKWRSTSSPQWQLSVERKQTRGCSWKLLEERHTLNELGIVYNIIFSVTVNMILYKHAAP